MVALPGPRQAGKTTLARLLAAGLPDTEIHHFDLESPGDLARLANPELVLSSLRGPVIPQMLAHYHGQILQVSELARSLGTGEPSTRRYLDKWG